MLTATPSFATQTGTAPGTTTLMPYGVMSDMRGLRGAGLGVIDETDRWRTGDPYGLPGTTVVKLTPSGGAAGLLGAGLGSGSMSMGSLIALGVFAVGGLVALGYVLGKK
jgi:hypothetical protein